MTASTSSPPWHDTLVDRVALVTGAGSGIGRASARLLAAAGARVAVLTHRREEADDAVAEIAADGGTALALVADVADAAQVAAACERVKGKWGRLDIVVANAGINGLWAPVDEIEPDEWQRTLQVNLAGTYHTVHSAVPLLKQQGGAVVIISSVNGTRVFSNSGASAYASSKAGQLAFARMTALELAPSRIRVNTVCPGAIRTNISENTEQRDVESVRIPAEFPEGSIPLTGDQPGAADQVARLVWFLVSDLSNHITGTEVFIDGGESLLRG